MPSPRSRKNWKKPEGWDDIRKEAYSDELGGDDSVYVSASRQNDRFTKHMSEDEWSRLDGLQISDPYMLLLMYDELLREGKEPMHQWQIKTLLEFAKPLELDENGEPKLNRISLRANNGSGKSQFVVAPCSVWLCMAHKKARAVITSGSGTQLDRQVGKSITHLCQRINEYHQAELWRCNYRFLTFLPTGSTIELYATNDPKKAEGYHKHRGGKEFAMFVDEAKSVKTIIYEAISRCNGMTRRLDTSSPGNPEGHFYEVCGPNEIEPGKFHRVGNWKTMRVTWRECPHLSGDEISEAIARHGIKSPWFKSSYEALFSAVSEFIVISRDQLNKCKTFAPVGRFIGARYGGLDLALGGDETVLSIWHGNKQIAQECFKFEDSVKSVEHIIRMMRKWNLNPRNVVADDGVAGRSQIDMLHAAGYYVVRRRNDEAARDKKTFANRGAEMWWNLLAYVEKCDLIFLNDPILEAQLTTRFYKFQQQTGRILLESKQDARSNGHESPDRADAAVLALSQHVYPMFRNISQRELDRSVRKSQQEIFDEIAASKFAASGIDSALDIRRGETFTNHCNYDIRTI